MATCFFFFLSPVHPTPAQELDERDSTPREFAGRDHNIDYQSASVCPFRDLKISSDDFSNITDSL